MGLLDPDEKAEYDNIVRDLDHVECKEMKRELDYAMSGHEDWELGMYMVGIGTLIKRMRSPREACVRVTARSQLAS